MSVPRLVVAAALVDDLTTPRRLLASRRSTPAGLAGRWELPGGKVEPGERPEDALRREIAEELGVVPVLGEEVRRDGGGPWPITADLELRVWLAHAPGTVRPGDSHDAVRWLGADQLDEPDWLDADRPVVRQLRGRLQPAPRQRGLASPGPPPTLGS